MSYLPRTRLGWKRLFWITLRRCYGCHGSTFISWHPGDGDWRWCMKCGGRWQPFGFFHALRLNHAASKDQSP